MTTCPMCKDVELLPSTYDENLPINTCQSCGGAWLRANEYIIWLRTQTPGSYNLDEIKELNSSQLIKDSQQAAFCPDCNHFMRSYLVESNIGFHLDRCSNCNGVWLDQNEWQILKAADLHDEINQIFTKSWQKHIHDKKITARMAKMYQEKFGDKDYEKIKDIRKWLAENPNRNMLLAYLIDEDPYSM